MTITRGTGVRRLSVTDLDDIHALLATDPCTGVFLQYQVDMASTERPWVGAWLWGHFVDGRLDALLHTGANIVPFAASDAALDAFVDRLQAAPIRPGSLVGTTQAVQHLWRGMADRWGQPRSQRLDQPFLVIDHDPTWPGDGRLRRVLIDEIDVLYPASVAMYTEELGIDPRLENPRGYRARVAQLVAAGWAWAIFDEEGIVFKAEVGAASASACQIQGVWVRPDCRGRGIAAAAMAQLVRTVRREVAPRVTLYVNAYNSSARAVYDRVGFRQIDTFGSILL